MFQKQNHDLLVLREPEAERLRWQQLLHHSLVTVFSRSLGNVVLIPTLATDMANVA